MNDLVFGIFFIMTFFFIAHLIASAITDSHHNINSLISGISIAILLVIITFNYQEKYHPKDKVVEKQKPVINPSIFELVYQSHDFPPFSNKVSIIRLKSTGECFMRVDTIQDHTLVKTDYCETLKENK